MVLAGEAVVQDPSDPIRLVAAGVVAEQEVREQQVAALGEDWYRLAELAAAGRAALQ